MDDQTAITIQEATANPVEYIDLFIPLVRYKGGNFWTTGGGCFNTSAEAIQSIKSYTGIEDAKILHHVERFVMTAG